MGPSYGYRYIYQLIKKVACGRLFLFALKADDCKMKGIERGQRRMKAGSWLHNTIGILIVIVSIYLAIQKWPDSKIAAIFLFVFAIVITVLITAFTKKRREIEKGE